MQIARVSFFSFVRGTSGTTFRLLNISQQ